MGGHREGRRQSLQLIEDFKRDQRSPMLNDRGFCVAVVTGTALIAVIVAMRLGPVLASPPIWPTLAFATAGVVALGAVIGWFQLGRRNGRARESACEKAETPRTIPEAVKVSVEDRDNAELYLKLIEYLNRRHDLRANNEWKVTLSLWTMLVATIAFTLSQRVVVWWPFFIPFPVLHVLWLRGQWVGHEMYKAEMNYWFDRARLSALGGNADEWTRIPKGPRHPQWVERFRRSFGKSTAFGFLTNWANPLIIAVTIMLSIAGGYLPTLQRDQVQTETHTIVEPR